MIALSVKTLEASRVRSAPQPMVSQRPAANARQPTPGGAAFGKMRGYLDLAFMGAAFLLLETKNVVQFALLFGATWFVNSLVFAAVLVAVYLAVETANRVRLPRPLILYGLLIAALAVAWLVPQEAVLDLPPVTRFLAGGALAFAPIYLANLVFAQRFSGVETSSTAFAANLLGAMEGQVQGDRPRRPSRQRHRMLTHHPPQ
jgi:hypothetical protein